MTLFPLIYRITMIVSLLAISATSLVEDNNYKILRDKLITSRQREIIQRSKRKMNKQIPRKTKKQVSIKSVRNEAHKIDLKELDRVPIGLRTKLNGQSEEINASNEDRNTTYDYSDSANENDLKIIRTSEGIRKRARGISMMEFEGILQTDTGSLYSRKNIDSNAAWKNDTDIVPDDNIEILNVDVTVELITFLVCNGKRGEAGIQRLDAIINHFFDSKEGYDKKRLDMLINSLEKTCWSVRSTLDKFHNLPRPLYALQFSGAMKLGKGTVGGALGVNKELVSDSIQILETRTSEFSVELWPDSLLEISLQMKFEEVVYDIKQGLKKTKPKCSISTTRGGIEFDIVDSKIPDVTIRRFGNYSPDCYLEFIDLLSRKPEIKFIMPITEMAPTNYISSWIVQSRKRGSFPFFASKLLGEGQVVQVSDTGVDDRNAYLFDTDGVIQSSKNGNVFNFKRKVVQYVSLEAGIFDKDGHGTHVCGTIAGNNIIPKSKKEYFNGIAPNAKIAFYKIFDNDGSFKLKSQEVERMLNIGRKAKSFIHNASWGAKEPKNGYGKFSHAFDQYIFSHPASLVLVSAGNWGTKRTNLCPDEANCGNTVSEPGTAKNIISVGSSENARNLEKGRLGYDYVADFSARGPSLDNRIKPDVVAPGIDIRSAASKRKWKIQPERMGYNLTKKRNGTSMSTAVVSGTAALIREYFLDGYYPKGEADSTKRLFPTAGEFFIF